jgi:hypothetical protein
MRGIIFAKIKQFFQDLNFGSEWEEPRKKNLKIDGGEKKNSRGNKMDCFEK